MKSFEDTRFEDSVVRGYRRGTSSDSPNIVTTAEWRLLEILRRYLLSSTDMLHNPHRTHFSTLLFSCYSWFIDCVGFPRRLRMLPTLSACFGVLPSSTPFSRMSLLSRATCATNISCHSPLMHCRSQRSPLRTRAFSLWRR